MSPGCVFAGDEQQQGTNHHDARCFHWSAGDISVEMIGQVEEQAEASALCVRLLGLRLRAYSYLSELNITVFRSSI